MRLPRFRIRTLMIAVASAAIGIAAAPRTYVEYPCRVVEAVEIIHDYSTLHILAVATVIGAGAFAALIGLCALLAGISARQRMIAVAIIGVTLGLDCRRRRLDELAEHHEGLMLAYRDWAKTTIVPAATPEKVERNLVKGNWHEKLGEKYRQAAGRPWLPVEPDPPEPK